MESDKTIVSARKHFKTEASVLSALTNSSLQETVLTRQSLEALKSRGQEYLQGLPSQTLLRRRKPSPLLWRLIVILGDSSILLPLLLWLAKPPFLEGQGTSQGLSGLPMDNVVWIFLAFASWTFAVHILQAQDFAQASSRLKSPLYALCALGWLVIFLALLFYLCVGGKIMAYGEELLSFLAIAAFTLVIWRVLVAEGIHLPAFRRRAVIIGANPRARELARTFAQVRHRSVDVIGYIEEGENAGDTLDGLPLFGGAEALRVLQQHALIDLMLVTIDYKENDELFRAVLEGAQQGLTLLPGTAAYENVSGKIPVEHVGDQWYMILPEQQSPQPLLYVCWRKTIDLLFGLCGLAVLGLILPLMALVISLDSPGPIFYKQERAGYQGKTFQILKFRSMYPEGSQAPKSAWASKGDARITRVGRIMRATHLDELPQMLNIVRGDMSLIGPRPERPAYVAELAQQSTFYRYRLSVKPGLTGWAQVKYGYGSSEQDELLKLQYDLFYIKHQSCLLDISILLRTVREVVLCHGV